VRREPELCYPTSNRSPFYSFGGPPSAASGRSGAPGGGIDTLCDPAKRPHTGDARRDLIAHLDNMRRNFDMSLAGTLLMEEPHNPRLITLFRERMLQPRRRIIRDTIDAGMARGQIRPDLDVEPIIDYLLGALFAAVLSTGRPGASWPATTIDALWPALSTQRQPADISNSKRRR
jgi:hypothetical protein